VILEQQKTKQRQQIVANQQNTDRLFLKCWLDPACKPKINQKFGPWNLPNTIKQQNNIAQAWMSTNWSGICDELTKVSSPTLIMTGADDNNVP
jgi:hypothetical protein